MKVILSRKGFDSANGGIVSPIFEDGTMVSFPIPSDDKDTYEDLQYNGISYSKILADLKYKGGIHCHVDPDLDQSRRINKISGWEPAFGQIDASASYLKNIGVEEGDLFLFFGNFHRVMKENGHYKYVRRTGDFYNDKDLQVIWGYLQVGEILDNPEKIKEITWHPHACDKRINNGTNMIFKATETLSFDRSKPGAGLLSFDKKRVLTLENANKATWKKNRVYDLDNVLSSRQNSAKDPSIGIYYAGIWQELGLVESEECSKWAISVIE
ncbi:hypothetical protein BXO88_03850 [Oribacterium sp. C9]|uniref:Nmad3 family putative nucleotide modification protein n=1 Tax=Oribacterium sp. C9 TaxID=1943579 RepID=UPI0009900787|nr:hypothetical protein [Oribacterium sp. C9]OON87418.1 hypothetical protein BXO88_03850 [Oribacterium sp. C9]